MAEKQYRVAATMVVVRVPGAQGGEVYLREGRLLPSSVTATERKRLLKLGLVAEAVDVTAAAEALEQARLQREAADAAEFEKRVQEAAAKIVADRDAATTTPETPATTTPATTPASKPATKPATTK